MCLQKYEKINDHFFKTINVNWIVNYSYLAIRLERSASFASLIRLYVNSMNILFGLEECAGRIGNPKTI